MLIFKKNLSLLCLAICAVIMLSTGCASTRTQENPTQYMGSSAITTQVKADLLADPKISSLQINVKTFKNIVQLSGFVDTYEQKQRAVAIAQNVHGVASVRDSLVVKPRRHKS